MQYINKRFILVILSFFTISLLFGEENIHMKRFKGQAISPYVRDITDLSLIIYKEYPHLYEGTEEEYLPFIEHYTHSKCGIACLLFDHAKPIGVAIGMPMSAMRGKYQQPLLNARPEENFDTLFYLGELLLLKEYRGRGFGKQMYLELEQLVREEGAFKKICFCTIDEADLKSNPMKPKDYTSLDGFWRKLGFEKYNDITFSVYWRNLFEADDTPHKMSYWIKSFSDH